MEDTRYMSPARLFIVFCILFISIVATSSTTTAQKADTPLSRHQINMYVEYNKVLVESTMRFDDPTTANFSIELPLDAGSINNQVDDFEYPAILEGNRLMFFLNNNSEVSYYYITDDLLDKDSFIASMQVPFDTDKLRIKLYLPEDAALMKPIRKGAISGSSVYPRPDNLDTDGRVVILVWDFDDLKKGENLDLFVRYEMPFQYWPHLTFVIIITAIILISSILYLSNRRHRKSRTHTIKPQTQERDVSEHLKEDEQQILTILRRKEGRCEQGTLRVVTGFSKAKLSGLLKEMEERKVIHKEKRGKKNLVFLK